MFRSIVIGITCLVLAGCGGLPKKLFAEQQQQIEPLVSNSRQAETRFLPTVVPYYGEEAPGTIIVSTGERYLYHVRNDGFADRYGVGVGREGFEWSGRAVIGRKAEWPSWYPPEEMRARELAQNGRVLPEKMEGGPDNPLGARALYLYADGHDTMYRIHGTNQPWTIGTAASSGCIRMMNEDVIDLFEQVGEGAPVVVL